MAVVVTATTPRRTADRYDESQRRIGSEGALAAGCTQHIAGPGAEGSRVVAGWNSPEALQGFVTETLRPILTGLGVAPPPAPPAVRPLHAQIG
ncbi:MAG: hypothetical protein JWQ99_4026 [Blastococcus sp.]|jgi:hypothetical protein|nr:hypothetical protein [Blastococcus sp.]